MDLKQVTDGTAPPADIVYNGERLLIKGTDVSDICTELHAEVRGGAVNKVTLTFSNVDVIVRKNDTLP